MPKPFIKIEPEDEVTEVELEVLDLSTLNTMLAKIEEEKGVWMEEKRKLIKELSHQKNSFKIELETVRETLRKTKQETRTLEYQFKNQSSALKNTTEVKDDLMSKLDKEIQKVKTLQEELILLKNKNEDELSVLKNNLDEVDQEKKDIQEQNTKLQNELDSVKERKGTLKLHLTKKMSILNKKESENDNLIVKLDESNQKIQTLQNSTNAYLQEIKKLTLLKLQNAEKLSAFKMKLLQIKKDKELLKQHLETSISSALEDLNTNLLLHRQNNKEKLSALEKKLLETENDKKSLEQGLDEIKKLENQKSAQLMQAKKEMENLKQSKGKQNLEIKALKTDLTNSEDAKKKLENKIKNEFVPHQTKLEEIVKGNEMNVLGLRDLQEELAAVKITLQKTQTYNEDFRKSIEDSLTKSILLDKQREEQISAIQAEKKGMENHLLYMTESYAKELKTRIQSFETQASTSNVDPPIKATSFSPMKSNVSKSMDLTGTPMTPESSQKSASDSGDVDNSATSSEGFNKSGDTGNAGSDSEIGSRRSTRVIKPRKREINDDDSSTNSKKKKTKRSHLTYNLNCTHCERVFMDKKSFEEHNNFHAGIKPYKCGCGFETCYARTFTAHQNSREKCFTLPNSTI